MKYFSILFLLLLFVACDDETAICDQTLSTLTRIQLSQDSAGIIRDTTMEDVILYALGRDTIYNNLSLDMLFLQLAPMADSSRYYLKVDSFSVADTVLIRYKRSPHFVSPGCGFTTFFSLDTVITTRNTIDSAIILQKEVTTSDETHIDLRFNRL